jgi:hypothetical protein
LLARLLIYLAAAEYKYTSSIHASYTTAIYAPPSGGSTDSTNHIFSVAYPQFKISPQQKTCSENAVAYHLPAIDISSSSCKTHTQNLNPN